MNQRYKDAEVNPHMKGIRLVWPITRERVIESGVIINGKKITTKVSKI